MSVTASATVPELSVMVRVRLNGVSARTANKYAMIDKLRSWSIILAAFDCSASHINIQMAKTHIPEVSSSKHANLNSRECVCRALGASRVPSP